MQSADASLVYHKIKKMLHKDVLCITSVTQHPPQDAIQSGSWCLIISIHLEKNATSNVLVFSEFFGSDNSPDYLPYLPSVS